MPHTHFRGYIISRGIKIVRMILLQHCFNEEPPLFCDMRTGNWGHGKPQAVPTVCSYTVMGLTALLPDPMDFSQYKVDTNGHHIEDIH